MVFRVSKLYLPLITTPKNAVVKSNLPTSKSQKLLTEHGFIRATGNGFFHLLPLAQKVLDQCNALIDHFMRKVAGQKMTLPLLTSSSLWKKSGRLGEVAELFVLKDKHKKEFVLSPTHEEAVTELLGMSSPISYRQLPLRLYQIGTKFRDEIKPRFGLLRTKEFIMCDLYTFDVDSKDALDTYEEVNKVYESLFNTLEISWLRVKADNSTMGGSRSDEYHILSHIGEDNLKLCENCNYSWNEEINTENSSCLRCKSNNLTMKKGVEVAHTFILDEKYSLPLGATSLLPSGKQKPLVMGCYGIGVTRLLAACVESLSHDDALVWPTLLAPFDLCIIPPKDGSKEQTYGSDWVEKLCNDAKRTCGESAILLDDRTHITIGKRLLDSRRIGIPLLLVIGSRITETPPKFELHYTKGNSVKVLEYSELLKELAKYKENKDKLWKNNCDY